ncbi:probable sodium/potassium/calcium exchanger CG1090 [Sitophilus oryzae]|uniref:Probable sodium/potassium/calcium exchanger CG1090 n=1 Tax=Sitophilus oryzae TaxID=7048 RepID=A0A6J2YJK3_SITOR|nr:probable sodium/potassium/calcium exchanger CG1090 [Sitophilus oryzae]XP_030764213.1 probable sodium/potassium/calcium exchanger CG1090 [Sitophilus oryzae]
MRRSERHKFIKISVFFLVYSIIQVVSPIKKDNVPTESPPTIPATLKPPEEKVSSLPGTATPPKIDETSKVADLENKPKQHEASKNEQNSNKKTAETKSNSEERNEEVGRTVKNVSTSTSTNATNGQKEPVGTEATEPEHTQNITATPTNVTISKNVTTECTPAAIRQFPRPLMPQRIRKHGGLILHTIVAVYMFIGLAIVCDEYFVASLDRICEELKMSPDVAGATFMAAGSSAPELATVIIGVFYAEDDIGISGVIGSAVFNIMFVISVCALSTGAVVYLNWWPLVRDSFFYAISILMMLAVIGDKDVNWLESTVMLVTYFIYCIVLHFNTPLEKWAQTWPVPFKTVAPNEQSGLVSYKTLEEQRQKHTNYGMEWNETNEQEQQAQQPQQESSPPAWNPGQDWSPEKQAPQETFQQQQLSGPVLNQVSNDPVLPQPLPSGPVQHDYYRPKEFDPTTKINPLVKPADEAGQWARIKWTVLYPIHFFCIYTMPDCRSEKYRNWYPFTFFVSMVWISFYSYFMVWMITIIGYTLGIPDTVMGLTFVAAGVSVPDALSSIAVIKEGYGDMAVSNAIGSNVFDILVCLGLPWFIKTALVTPGAHVKVISKGLMYSTFSLLSTVAFLVVAIHYNGWKLDRRFGIVLMVWYLVFITFASLYELNVFGNLNPPECVTDY